MILLKVVVPTVLDGSEAARKNTLINALEGFHGQADPHYQEFHHFPSAVQATGTPTATR